jgi:hypothetical protein
MRFSIDRSGHVFFAILLLAAIGVPQNGGAQASVVRDMRGALGALLGHPPKLLKARDGELLGLARAQSREAPWSGSYWPDINGGIASHYRDHTVLGSQLWFVLRYGAAKIRLTRDFDAVRNGFGSFTQEELDQRLSPSEKYDLLLGNGQFEFTRAILADIEFRAGHLKKSKMNDGTERADMEQFEGVNNNEHFLDVQSSYARFDDDVLYRYWKRRPDSISYWFGICDGWSPASIYLPRPVRPVTVTGRLGHRITFFPDDLKALGSYLFARTNNDHMNTMNYRFAGRPCAEWGDPVVDREGYVKDFRCNDVDAGLFHLALLNRIGLDRMGFMIDIDNNHKINNHPVGSYELRYFNLANGREGSLEASVVPRIAVEDGFARRRHPQAVALVGVKARVTYRYYQWTENNRDLTFDSPGLDRVRSEEYTYDLELDREGAVLGGEWGNRYDEDVEESVLYAKQPDFLWMAAPDALPYSEQSLYTIAGKTRDSSNPRPFGNTDWSWDGRGPLPEDWLAAARADLEWSPPVVGELRKIQRRRSEVFPPEARDPLLKPAQPLSTLVYFLFDQARDPERSR